MPGDTSRSRRSDGSLGAAPASGMMSFSKNRLATCACAWGSRLERNRHRLVVPDAVGRVLRPSRALQLPDALEQRVAVLRQLPGPARTRSTTARS